MADSKLKALKAYLSEAVQKTDRRLALFICRQAPARCAE